MRDPLEEQIRQLDWPKPPAELRARILRDADAGPARIVWSDRLWFSRAFRWSVAAAVVAIVAINVAGGLQPAGPAGVEPAESTATVRAIEDSVVEVGLPADFAKSLARRAVVVRAAAARLALDGGGDQ